MNINYLIKSKYFKLKNDVIDENDLLFNLYEIVEYNSLNNIIKTILLSSFEEDIITFNINEINKDQFIFFEEDLILKEIDKRRELSKKENEEYERKLCEEFLNNENIRNNNFLLINPKYKRHTKVLLVGKYNKSYIDFTKKGDVFFIDDVKIINDEIYYYLRVVCPRKNRGIYVFRTSNGFKEEFIAIDKNNNRELDYDYQIFNNICSIKKREELL